MTGFGKAVAVLPNKKVIIEIKTLNSKQLDLLARVAPLYREKEIEMRTLLAQRLERGKVEFNLSIESMGVTSETRINEAVVSSYKMQIDELSVKLGIEPPKDWFATLLRLPEIIKSGCDAVSDEEWLGVVEAINLAADKVMEFRRREGEMLARFLEEKIARIETLLIEIDSYENERLDKIRSRIMDNLLSLPDVEVDMNRFEQEMIYYIEKFDVNEEKSRLNNHLKYFLETLRDDSTGQGKKLGFIVQEIGREINTLGSKSNHAEMQQIVVRMKDELEQIKEQILNVL
jgi:uncharacterized protein (TIGR00255 family)